MKSIATALASAQMNMGKALKQANNPHFRSKYADLGNVMDACLPALNEAGIAVIQPAGEDEHGRFVDTILIHGESGESLASRVPLIVQKNDMQGYGSAVTYARRYGLMAMAGIAPEDDDGNAASKAAPKREAPKPPEVDPQAIKQATEYLAQADSLDDLKERWSNLPKPTAAHADVVAAKNAAKKNLTMPDNSDIGDDQIPY
jgi:hypothetical protein